MGSRDNNRRKLGIVGNQFINVYSKENPILEEGDECYAMITNVTEYHYPLIVRGVVYLSRIIQGYHKQNFIIIKEILEPAHVINDHLFDKTFETYLKIGKTKDGIGLQTLTHLDKQFRFSDNLFKVDCFFTRATHEQILEHRKDYIAYIRENLQNRLKDIESL